MEKVYEHDTGPEIDGSGAYLGIVFPRGEWWIAETLGLVFEAFRSKADAKAWLREPVEMQEAA